MLLSKAGVLDQGAIKSPEKESLRQHVDEVDVCVGNVDPFRRMIDERGEKEVDVLGRTTSRAR